MDLIDHIKKGEGKTLEFKEKFPSGEQIAKTIVTFSNTAGGKLIIGVNSNNEITGLNDDDRTGYQDRVSNIIHDVIHPATAPEIYSYNIDGKNILVVEVFPGPLKPYFIKNKGKFEGTYIRIGSTNKKADIEFIQELERQRKNISFDEEITDDDDCKKINAASLSKILNEKNVRDSKATPSAFS